MSVVHWLSPGAPDQRTGGYLYNQRIARASRALGFRPVFHALPGAWPDLSTVDRERCRLILKSLPGLQPVVVDGLAWTALGDLRSELGDRRRLVLLHSPLWREAPDRAASRTAERAALLDASIAVATSPSTLADLEPDCPTALVPPGIDLANTVAALDGHRLACVATVTPRKHVIGLLSGLAQVEVPWSLAVVGSLNRDPSYVRAVRRALDELGVEHRVRLLGELDDRGVQRVLLDCAALVHAAHYESWGMGIAEAMAAGLPIVTTPAGVVDAHPAGTTVVPRDNPAALADAVTRLLTKYPHRRRQGAMARASAEQMASWTEASAAFHAHLDR